MTDYRSHDAMDQREDLHGCRVDRDDFWTPHVVEHFLAPAIARHGTQAAFAKSCGVSAAYVSDVVRGNREPGRTILDALGLERVVSYRRKVR